MFTCRIVGIDDLEFEQINQTLGSTLKKEAFKDGNIAFVSKTFTDGDNGIVGKNVRFSIPTAFNPNEEESIEIGALLESQPYYYSAGYTPDLIVSNDYFEKLVKEPLIEMVKVDYDDPFSKSIETSIMDLIKDNQFVSICYRQVYKTVPMNLLFWKVSV